MLVLQDSRQVLMANVLMWMSATTVSEALVPEEQAAPTKKDLSLVLVPVEHLEIPTMEFANP